MVLPRLIDKCRADLVGKIGEYHTDCTLDREFLEFTGIDYSDLRKQIATGQGDGELLEWIEANATRKRSPWEISEWSSYQTVRAPGSLTELHTYFLSVLESHSKKRGDVGTWADLLDLDDFCSFGGIA